MNAELKQFQRDLRAAPKLPGNVRLLNIRIDHGSVSLDWVRLDGRRKPRFLTTKAAKNPDHHNAGRGVA